MAKNPSNNPKKSPEKAENKEAQPAKSPIWQKNNEITDEIRRVFSEKVKDDSLRRWVDGRALEKDKDEKERALDFDNFFAILENEDDFDLLKWMHIPSLNLEAETISLANLIGSWREFESIWEVRKLSECLQKIWKDKKKGRIDAFLASVFKEKFKAEIVRIKGQDTQELLEKFNNLTYDSLTLVEVINQIILFMNDSKLNIDMNKITVSFSDFLSHFNLKLSDNYKDWDEEVKLVLNAIVSYLHVPTLKEEMKFYNYEAEKYKEIFTKWVNKNNLDKVADRMGDLWVPREYLEKLVDIYTRKLELPDGTILDIKHTPDKVVIDLGKSTNLTLENKSILKMMIPDADNSDSERLFLPKDEGWKLITLYLMAEEAEKENSKIFKILPQPGKAVQDFLEEPPKSMKEIDEKLQEDFLKSWKNMKWYKFPEDKDTKYKIGDKEESIPGFNVGTRLAMQDGDSWLKPDGWKNWNYVEIVGIDWENWTIDVKANWWEAKLEKSEGRLVKLSLEAIIKEGWKFYKLPNPKDSKDPIEHLKKLNEAELPNKFWVFGLLTRDKGKFIKDVINEKWEIRQEEVSHFGNQYETMEEWKMKLTNIVYKVKHNPDTKSFVVSSEQIHYENSKETYSQEMDYNSFCIFIAEKWLQPLTNKETEKRQEEYKKETMKNTLPKKWKWMSIWAIIWWVKWFRTKATKDRLEAKKKKNQEDFENYLLEGWLWIKLWHIPWFKDWADEMQSEFEAKKENKNRKEIEKWLKKFEKDYDWGSMFDGEDTGLKEIFWWKGYVDWLKDDKYLGEDLTDLNDLHKWAALLLAMIWKWKSPYRWKIDSEATKALRVKKLLWPRHHVHFLRQREQMINKIKQNPSQNLDDMVRWEMSYIVNTVRWNPNGDWWTIEANDSDKGLLANLSKQIFSENFANQLDEKSKAWANASTVEAELDKMKEINNFDEVIANANKNKTGRIQQAIAATIRAWQLADTSGQYRRVKQAFLFILLSWDVNTYCKKETKKLITNHCLAMGFVPWFLAEDWDHQAKIKHLLDKATNGNFWQEVKFKDKTGLEDALSKWRNTDKNYNDLEKWFKSGFRYDEWDAVIKEFQDKRDNSGEIPNKWWEKSIVIKNAGLDSSNSLVNKWMNYRGWKFDDKDQDKDKDITDFWGAILKDLKGISSSNSSQEVKFWIKKFLSYFAGQWFSEWMYKEVFSRLLTAKDQWTPTVQKQLLWYITKWQILSKVWQNYPPDVFDQVLEEFYNIFSKNLGKIVWERKTDIFWKLEDVRSLPFVPPEQFNSLWKWGELERPIGSWKKHKKNFFELNATITQINKSLKNRQVSTPSWFGLWDPMDEDEENDNDSDDSSDNE